MTFGEKVKQARTELGLTQVQLGKILGVSQRTITAYETDTFPPRTRDAYCRLADALHVNVNYLLTQEDAFVLGAGERYGYRGKKGAEALVGELTGLFSGGELAEEDMDELMLAIQKAYEIAKENNRKYARKDHTEKND